MVTEAQKRATAKYTKENYDTILVKAPKGTKEQIKATGETVNGFIVRAIQKALEEREKA